MIMSNNDTFIASNVVSFEDFINSPVSVDKSIHCTFSYEDLEADFYIKKKLISMRIKFVSFPNGSKLKPPFFNPS